MSALAQYPFEFIKVEVPEMTDTQEEGMLQQTYFYLEYLNEEGRKHILEASPEVCDKILLWTDRPIPTDLLVDKLQELRETVGKPFLLNPFKKNDFIFNECSKVGCFELEHPKPEDYTFTNYYSPAYDLALNASPISTAPSNGLLFGYVVSPCSSSSSLASFYEDLAKEGAGESAREGSSTPELDGEAPEF